jgi:DNA polymerase-3 subunit alpha
LDDSKTFELLGKGETQGVFQFESEGMRKILKEAQPASISDIIALNSLYRPGPMEYIPQFIARKHGREVIEYPDPCFEDILKETYGIIVYQEQLMLIVQKITGCSPGKADLFRRDIRKRKSEIQEMQKKWFIDAAGVNGFSEQDADRIFNLLILGENWSFNKSHATAYALLAYQCAYLKANFPEEFENAI